MRACYHTWNTGCGRLADARALTPVATADVHTESGWRWRSHTTMLNLAARRIPATICMPPRRRRGRRWPARAITITISAALRAAAARTADHSRWRRRWGARATSAAALRAREWRPSMRARTALSTIRITKDPAARWRRWFWRLVPTPAQTTNFFENMQLRSYQNVGQMLVKCWSNVGQINK